MIGYLIGDGMPLLLLLLLLLQLASSSPYTTAVHADAVDGERSSALREAFRVRSGSRGMVDGEMSNAAAAAAGISLVVVNHNHRSTPSLRSALPP